jgi:hypothetical protein
MTPILAKVAAIEKRGDQYQVIVQISPNIEVHLIPLPLERSNRTAVPLRIKAPA